MYRITVYISDYLREAYAEDETNALLICDLLKKHVQEKFPEFSHVVKVKIIKQYVDWMSIGYDDLKEMCK